MSLVPVTYIKAGETPSNWFDLSVIDRKTGKDVSFVIEADTKSGWVRRQAVGRGGQFVVDEGGFVIETIKGDFAIVNPGVPGSPVAMVEGEAEPEAAKHILSRRSRPKKKSPEKVRCSSTTRVVFGARGVGRALIVGPGGQCNLPSAQFAILMTLCGKHERHVCEWMYLAESVWPHPDDMPDCWKDVLDVHVCNLRKALKLINSEIKIVTCWGRGYSALRGPYPINDNSEEAAAARA